MRTDLQNNTLNELVDYSRDILGLKKGDRLCVPFSGGLDSSLVLSIAKEVVGVNGVRAIRMKHDLTEAIEVEHSIEIAESLGIKTHVIDANRVIEACESALNPFFEGEGASTSLPITRANRILYPMVRMIASGWSARVPGTLDGTEIKCGYFPKESCTGDFSWIAGMSRSKVRSLACKMGMSNLSERLRVVEGCGDIVSFVNEVIGASYQSEIQLDRALRDSIKSNVGRLYELIITMSHKARSVLEGRPIFGISSAESDLIYD